MKWQALKSRLQDTLNDAQSEGVFDKAVLGVFVQKTPFFINIDTPVDSIFDVASVTKACPTALLALNAILKKDLDLNDKVVDFIPEFNTSDAHLVTVYHLLTHSLDYRVPMSRLKHLKPTAILEYLYTYSFEKAPGSVFNYGNPPSVLLGILLQNFYKKNLNDLAQSLLFDPLQMKDTGWFPLKKHPKERIIPTEFCEFRNKEIQGLVHDESAFVLEKLFPVGSAGLFSTAPDLLRCMQMLLQDGVFEGKSILPTGILDLISNNALPSEMSSQTALGFELNKPKFMGNLAPEGTFGKTGFTGASVMGNAKHEVAMVLLSNFTWRKREANPDRIFKLRAQLSDDIFSSLSK